MIILEIKDLSLTFTEKGKVFENININIEKNKITLISGKSGCGKSSLLMCIAGAIPDAIDGTIKGEIIYNGRNIENKGMQAVSGSIAYMLQDPDSQLCTFTVEDEIAFGLENINTPSDIMEGIIDDTLKLTGIEYLKKRNLNSLSGGEKQKVALSSILAINPQLILMDEPTANLDPNSTMEIVKLIKRLRDEMGKTIVIVEHKISEFSDIVDNAIVFSNKGAQTFSRDDFINIYGKNNCILNRKKMLQINAPVIKVNNLYFSYDGETDVLKNLNFNLYHSEILAAIGSNGAGKSTLSKLLMGLLKTERGSILINGKDIRSMNPCEIGENMGLVFQNPEHQFIKNTVENELSLSLEIKGEKPADIRNKVENYLSLFNLVELRNMNSFSLSQGQKRRLSTASMMINGQPILILDEPTYGQDADNLNELVKLLYRINDDGVSILIITHDMRLVLSSCSRAIYLENGEIKYAGEAEKAVKNAFPEIGV